MQGAPQSTRYMQTIDLAYCAPEAVHSYLPAPVRGPVAWSVACRFAAVPAQGRAAGVMSGIALVGAPTTFGRLLVSPRPDGRTALVGGGRSLCPA